MPTLQDCKNFIRDYFYYSGFEITDENALDDVARELRDFCDEEGVRPEDLDAAVFARVIERDDL